MIIIIIIHSFVYKKKNNNNNNKLRPTAPIILIFKSRLTPALGIGVNLYLRISMFGAVARKTFCKHPWSTG